MSNSQSTLRSMGALALALLLAAVLAAPTFAKTELYFFSSPYCGPCQQLKPTVAQFAKAGYPVRQFDVTQHPALASQFRVDRVPCLVMVADGAEMFRQVGGDQQTIARMFATAGVTPNSQTVAPRPSTTGPAPSLPVLTERRTETVPVATSDTFSKQLLESSVRITVTDSTGKSYGTGTIIDTRQGDALVVTCGHLFRGESAQGDITIERFAVTSRGLQVIDRSQGKLESHDLGRDVGLVSFRPNTPVTSAKVASNFGERVNDRLWSVGCDLGADPTVRNTRVTDINRYNGAPNVECSGAPVQGRSGGGLFNQAGELVGICFAADNEGDEGLYSGLASVHAELDGLGLQDVYGGISMARGPQVADNSRDMAQLPSRPNIDTRGQDPDSTPSFPMEPITSPSPRPSQFPATPASVSTPPTELLNNLSPVEQASLQEIAQRAVESEIVVIVRPREAGSNSEVIKLNRVSPEFLQALRAMQP